MKIAIVATLIICGVFLVFNRIIYGTLLVALGSIIFYFRKGIEHNEVAYMDAETFESCDEAFIDLDNP